MKPKIFKPEVKKFYEEVYLNPESFFNKYRSGVKKGEVAFSGPFEELDSNQRNLLEKIMKRYKRLLPTYKKIQKNNLITLSEAGELVGIPDTVNKKGRITGGLRMRIVDAATRSKRNRPVAKKFVNDVLKKRLKLQKIDIGQGAPTLFIKKPNAQELEVLKDFYLASGSTKGGLTNSVINLIKDFHSNPKYKKFTNKGEIIPQELLPKNITIGQAAYAQAKLAQAYNGKKFPNTDLDIPTNKKAGRKYFKTVSKFLYNNPYKVAQNRVAMDTITEEIGKNYFTIDDKQTDMSSLRKTVKKIFLKEKIPFYDGKSKNPFGVNVNEIVGIAATSRVPGAAPYSQFVDLLEGRVNQVDYALFQKNFERYLNKMTDEVAKGDSGNPLKVVREYNKFTKRYINRITDPLARETIREVGFPTLSIQSPEKIYGTKRIKQLSEIGLDLPGAYEKMGFTIGVPKQTPTLKEIAQDPKTFISQASKTLLNQVSESGARSKSCQLILNKATGGIARSCSEAIKKDPIGSAEKLSKLDATSGPLAKVKNVATNILKSSGFKTFSVAGLAGGAGAALVKEFRNDDPLTYLSNEDQQKSMLVAMATEPIAPDFKRPDILDYQLPAVGASVAASTALGAPSTIKASRSRGLGVEKKGLARTTGRVLGRGLGIAASPGILAPLAAMDITDQIAEGDSAADIATNPLNYTYPLFAEQTDKFTRGLNPTFRKFARLGLGRAALTGLSRAGIAGLGASLAIQGLGLLDD